MDIKDLDQITQYFVQYMEDEELGYEINKFKLEPLYENGECIGLNVNVEPKRKLEFINITITIGKSSDFNTDESQ